MVKACSALFCSIRDTKESRLNGISFHKFPKRKDCRLAWAKATGRKGHKKSPWSPSSHAYLCSLHFVPSDFKDHMSLKKLKGDAVPSVFEYLNQNPVCKPSLHRTSLGLNSVHEICTESTFGSLVTKIPIKTDVSLAILGTKKIAKGLNKTDDSLVAPSTKKTDNSLVTPSTKKMVDSLVTPSSKKTDNSLVTFDTKKTARGLNKITSSIVTPTSDVKKTYFSLVGLTPVMTGSLVISSTTTPAGSLVTSSTATPASLLVTSTERKKASNRVRFPKQDLEMSRYDHSYYYNRNQISKENKFPNATELDNHHHHQENKVAIPRNEISALKRQLSRSESNLKSVNVKLHRLKTQLKEKSAVVSSLEGELELQRQLIQNLQERNETLEDRIKAFGKLPAELMAFRLGNTYSEQARVFALTLASYSSKAYDFVRQIFNLPNRRTLRHWKERIEEKNSENSSIEPNCNIVSVHVSPNIDPIASREPVLLKQLLNSN